MITAGSSQPDFAAATAPAWRKRRTSGITVLQPASIWWLSLASMCGLVLATRLGAGSVAACIGVWLIYFLAWPRRTIFWLSRTTLPWLLPALAVSSAAWSIEPALSMKAGIELFLFTATGIISASVQTARSFVSSFMCALLVGAVASVAFGGTSVIGTTGEVAFTGIFQSKNNFALFLCFLLISSLTVIADAGQPHRLRAIALIGLILGPLMLIKARSLGALFAGGIGLAAAAFVLMLGHVPLRRRGVVLMLLALAAVGVGILSLLAIANGIDMSSMLVAMGKDPSLTGRTFLWSRAKDYISLKPFLGIGYQAFWVQGHVEAEGLWRFAQIDSRSGFHFHNLYFETAVELGGLGVAILGCTLAAVLSAVMIRGLRQPDPPNAFFFGLFAFFAMRLMVELDFLEPFSPGSLLLPAAWVYAAGLRGAKLPPPRPRKMPFV